MSFLSRWQQRKAEVAREELESEVAAELTQEPQEVTVEAEGAEPEVAQASATETVEGDAEALPDPESIEQGGSFADFLKPGVDPTQRKDALRALWKQPQYNIRDGLCEYDLDYGAQPKLSAAVAAELAKNVFRHVTEAVEQVDKAVASQQERMGVEAEEQTDAAPQLAQTDTAENSSELPTVSGDTGQNDPHASEGVTGSRSEA